MGRGVIFFHSSLGFTGGDTAGRKINPAANVGATFYHAFFSPVKPGFIGVFLLAVTHGPVAHL
jgi:hypothetical protein